MDVHTPPRTGWIRGTCNGDPVDLTFDRRAGSVQGQAMGGDVTLTTSADDSQIQGREGSTPISLSQQWQPDHVDLRGSARDGDVSVHFDWSQSAGDGTVGGQPFSVRWDESGRVQGQAFGGEVSMRYDAASGALQGTMGRSQVDVTVTNLDLTDFMDHAWLLAP